MWICWLFGHRYDYDVKRPDWHALICTRCGNARVVYQIIAEAKPNSKP